MRAPVRNEVPFLFLSSLVIPCVIGSIRSPVQSKLPTLGCPLSSPNSSRQPLSNLSLAVFPFYRLGLAALSLLARAQAEGEVGRAARERAFSDGKDLTSKPTSLCVRNII